MRIKDVPVADAVQRILTENGYDVLYPPQADAISAGVLDGKSLVLASPTASGKTLVAELAVLKKVLEEHGKALYLTPLRALASEKYEEFQKYSSLVKADGTKVSIAITSGDYDRADDHVGKYDVIISTNEKADSLLRHRAKWISDITLVVADEVHLLTEAGRGPTLEVVLTRLRKLNPKMQVLALSATVRNAEEVAEWIGGSAITTEWRPVPLKEGVYCQSKIHFGDGSTRAVKVVTGNPVMDIAAQMVRDGGQALLFTETRRSAVGTGKRAALVLGKLLSAEDKRSLGIAARKIRSSGEKTVLSEMLAEQIARGAGFHHAGLLSAHRRVVEDTFRGGKIKILAATPTLCLHPDTLITTPYGPIRISEIAAGDMVLTHTGIFRKVIGTSVRQFEGNLLELKAAGMLPVLMTPEHRILYNTVRRVVSHTAGKPATLYCVRGEPEWIHASDVTRASDARHAKVREGYEVQTPVESLKMGKDHRATTVHIHNREFLGKNQFNSIFPHPTARPVPKDVRLDETLAELFGLYAAEGFTSRSGLVSFAIATYELKLTKFITEVMTSRFRVISKCADAIRHRRNVWACSRVLAEFFDTEFGRKAPNKHFPENLLTASPKIIAALLRGLCKGNGTLSTAYFNTVRLPTTSPRLAEQACRMMKKLGYMPHVARRAPRGMGKHAQYIVSLSGTQGAKFIVDVMGIRPSHLRVGNRTYNVQTRIGKTIRSPIRSARQVAYAGPVYNLHVDGDESYVCSFAFTVHNSAGVNLPARLVIITSHERYDAGYGRKPIPVLEYKQFCGRAGRPKYDKYGEAVLIADSENELQFLMENYVHAEPERLSSKLSAENVLRPHVLSTIATGFAHSTEGLRDFFSSTLCAHQYGARAINSRIDAILSFLAKEEMIEYGDDGRWLRATRFGRRVSELYIDPASAVIIRDGLYKRAAELTEFSYFHLIARTPDIAPRPYPRRGEDDKLAAIAAERAGQFMCETPDESSDSFGLGYEVFMSEVKAAAVLMDWIQEAPEDAILATHRVEPGDLLRLVDLTDWLLYSTYEIAELFGHKDILRQIEQLRLRVEKGVKAELIPLIRLHGVGRARARALYNAGLKTVGDIRKAPQAELVKVPLIGARVAKKIKDQTGGNVKPDQAEADSAHSETEQSLLTEY